MTPLSAIDIKQLQNFVKRYYFWNNTSWVLYSDLERKRLMLRNSNILILISCHQLMQEQNLCPIAIATVFKRIHKQSLHQRWIQPSFVLKPYERYCDVYVSWKKSSVWMFPPKIFKIKIICLKVLDVFQTFSLDDLKLKVTIFVSYRFRSVLFLRSPRLSNNREIPHTFKMRIKTHKTTLWNT